MCSLDQMQINILNMILLSFIMKQNFVDWASGGQWARCVQFLTTLAQALAEFQVSLCVCFNGSHPTPPALPQHWIQTQTIYKQRVNSVSIFVLKYVISY